MKLTKCFLPHIYCNFNYFFALIYCNYLILFSSLCESDKLPLIQSYKKKIETELEDICSDILEIIKNELIPNSDSEEGKVFYYKMKGDYHRYLAEFQVGDVRKDSAAKALEAYSSAS